MTTSLFAVAARSATILGTNFRICRRASYTPRSYASNGDVPTSTTDRSREHSAAETCPAMRRTRACSPSPVGSGFAPHECCRLRRRRTGLRLLRRDDRRMKRIYVVEYSMLARNRIRQALTWLDDCQIIGEADAANEGVDGVNDLDPDIVITDLLLKDGTGVDVVKRIRARHGPERPVIFVLANRPSPTHRAKLEEAGANGVFDKMREYGLLIDELRDVA